MNLTTCHRCGKTIDCPECNPSQRTPLRLAISAMLNKEADFLMALNLPGVPEDFKIKHDLEAGVLRHAAKVVMRDDLDWNACALDEMDKYVNEAPDRARREKA